VSSYVKYGSGSTEGGAGKYLERVDLLQETDFLGQVDMLSDGLVDLEVVKLCQNLGPHLKARKKQGCGREVPVTAVRESA
jgi:hypothetical protein